MLVKKSQKPSLKTELSMPPSFCGLIKINHMKTFSFMILMKYVKIKGRNLVIIKADCYFFRRMSVLKEINVTELFFFVASLLFLCAKSDFVFADNACKI